MQKKQGRKLILNPELEKSLDELLKVLQENYDTPAQWKAFYHFVAIAYRSSKEQRPSVSKFADILQAAQIPRSGSLAALYAHGLYMLAVYNEIPIYKSFNP